MAVKISWRNWGIVHINGNQAASLYKAVILLLPPYTAVTTALRDWGIARINGNE